MYFPKDLINKRTGDNWKYYQNKDTIIKKETVAAKMQPAANGIFRQMIHSGNLDGNSFKARPLKHWRKQRGPIYVGQTFTKTLEGNFAKPGATNIVSGETQCNTQCTNQQIIPPYTIAYRPTGDINNKIGKNAPPSFADYNTYVNKCPATTITVNNNNVETVAKCVSVCDPEKKARDRVRYPSVLNTNSAKPKYYTSNASYLRARCRTYNQNQYQYGDVGGDKCANLVTPGAFRTNCASCVGCAGGNACNQKISYYKPNNCKFAVQGGVSSSLRIAKLKYETAKNINR